MLDEQQNVCLFTFSGDIVYIKDFCFPSTSAILPMNYQLIFAVKNYVEIPTRGTEEKMERDIQVAFPG